MELFFVNCTKQHQVINIRQGESGKLIPHKIRVGGQSLVLKGATKEEVDAVLSQIEHFKPINISDIDSTAGITGIAYCIKAVSAEKIAQAVETYGNRLDEQSSEIIGHAAAAANQQVEERMQQVGATLKNSGIEIEQIMPVGSREKPRSVKVKVER